MPEQCRDAERRQAVQRFQKRVLADGVVNHRHFLAAGDLIDALHEILAGVNDGVSAAMRLRELRLLVAADDADHGGAKMFCPLAEDQADSAGRGVQ